jgi:hypothetical protein
MTKLQNPDIRICAAEQLVYPSMILIAWIGAEANSPIFTVYSASAQCGRSNLRFPILRLTRHLILPFALFDATVIAKKGRFLHSAKPPVIGFSYMARYSAVCSRVTL